MKSSLLVLTLFTGCLLVANLVPNGDFETPGKELPEGWEITRKHRERSTSRVTIETHRDPTSPAGPVCIRVTSPYTFIGDTYSTLRRSFSGVEEGKTYRLSFYLKGANAGRTALVFGKWKGDGFVRTGLIEPDRWRYYTYDFTAAKDSLEADGTFMIRFNFFTTFEELLIDGVSLVSADGLVTTVDNPPEMARVEISRIPATEHQDTFFADLKISGMELPEGWTLEAEITDVNGNTARCPMKVTEATRRRHLPAVKKFPALQRNQQLSVNAFFDLMIPAGEFRMKLYAGGIPLEGRETVFIKHASPVRAEMAGQKLRLATAEVQFATLLEKRKVLLAESHPLLEIYETVIPRQIELQGNDLNRQADDTFGLEYYAARGKIAVSEIEDALAAYAEEVRKLENGAVLPQVWRYRSSDITYPDGFPVAERENAAGDVARGHVFFGGYHHPADWSELPLLERIGGNAITMEIGPWHVFPKEGGDGEYRADPAYFDRLEQVMKEAYERNQWVDLLFATHYVPQWFRARYPETVIKAWNGFVPLDLRQPKTLELHRAFLQYVMVRLKESPYAGAVKNITLSNEPFYIGYNLNSAESARPAFRNYLAETYGTVQEFNRRSGAAYVDFDRMVDDGMDRNSKVRYDYIRFKQRELAGWHTWMRDIVKEHMPDVPVSAKLMIYDVFTEREVEQALDAELFAGFSDVNGYDNGTYYWPDYTHGADLQYSLNPVAGVNTESHLIPNGEQIRIDSDYVYTGTIQQYLFGASTVLLWTWANTQPDGPAWLDGSIHRRSLNIISHQRAIMDANRIAEDIVEFAKVQPEIAILYSPTSLILDRKNYCYALFRLYRILAVSGRKVGFLSEKQIQAGEFQHVKLLFAPETGNIQRETVDGLVKFQKRGRLAILGNALTADEYGNPLEESFPRAVRIQKADDAAAVTRLTDALPALPYRVRQLTQGHPDYVVLRRGARLPDGRWLLNIVNYDSTPHRMELDLKAGLNATDLLSGEPFGGSFDLPPHRPLLLEIK